jgi:hypothetical protein
MGPVNTIPLISKPTLSERGCPEDTAPQANAHMGGNQVTGLRSSKTAEGWGSAIPPFSFDKIKCQSKLTLF